MAKRPDTYGLSTAVLHVRMTDDELEQAHALARHRDVPVSVLVRSLLEREHDQWLVVAEQPYESLKKKRLSRSKTP